MNIELRKFEIEDAANVALLVGDENVSKWTSNIPFPYSEHDAIDWITTATKDRLKKPYAVELDGRLVACVSIGPTSHAASKWAIG